MSMKLLGLSIGLLLASGCSTLNPAKPDDPAYAPVSKNNLKAPRIRNGGIYQENHSMALFETLRARRIGDLLTITLDEKTDASKKASTTGKKDNTTDISDPTLFGKTVKFANGHNLSFNLEGKRNFSGDGESKQNNNLSGTITVTVSDVLPNGNLEIRGEKWLTLNQGDEYIRIKGLVRPADIRPDNTISSALVANARITYSGTGQVADTNVMGWLARFFMTDLWAF